MRVSVKSIDGVESVEVSLKNGLADIKLKPGNTVRMKQLQDAIAKNGFTTKQSNVVVNGFLSADGGASKLKVSGTDEVYILEPSSPSSAQATSFVAKNVTVTGTIPETPKGKSPDTIQLASIELAK